MVVGHHGVLIYGKNGVINFKVVEEIFLLTFAYCDSKYYIVL